MGKKKYPEIELWVKSVLNIVVLVTSVIDASVPFNDS